MSHFTVLVIGDDLEKQLEPFNENTQVAAYHDYVEDVEDWWFVTSQRREGVELDTSDLQGLADAYNEAYPDDAQQYAVDEKGLYTLSTYNPNSKWDYWRIGGRWAGAFLLKPGATGFMEELGWEWKPEFNQNEPPPDFTGKADQALKGDIDFDRMRRLAVDKAEVQYAKFETLVAQYGPLPDDSWRSLDARTEEFKAAREAYWNAPIIDGLRKADLIGWSGFPNEIFDVDVETYVEDARLSAIPGYAALYRYEWIEPGQMGWWGFSTDTGETRRQYHRRVNQILDTVDDDTQLTMVDCHI